MLKLFKSTTAFVPILIILALIFGLRTSVVLQAYYHDNWLGNLAPFSAALKSIFGTSLLPGVYFNIIFSAILIFFQSYLLSSILSFFKIEDFKGFLAAWLYVLMMHMFPSFVFLSPELIALSFILLSFRTIVNAEDSRSKNKVIFSSGLYIGLAACFWLPSTFFILCTLFFLNSYRSKIRHVLLLFIGFFVPYFYVLVYLYITNQSFGLVSLFQINQFQFQFYQPSQLLSYYILLFIILLSIPSSLKFLNKLLMREKKFFQLVFVYILCFVIVFFFQKENDINVMMPLMFPVAIFTSVYFNRIKRIFVAESLHLILLLTIIVNFIYFLN